MLTERDGIDVGNYIHASIKETQVKRAHSTFYTEWNRNGNQKFIFAGDHYVGVELWTV